MRIARSVVIGLLVGALLPKLLLPSRLDRVARPSEWAIGRRAVATLDERVLGGVLDKLAVVHYRVERVRGRSARMCEVDVSAYTWFALPYARHTVHCAWAPPAEGGSRSRVSRGSLETARRPV